MKRSTGRARGRLAAATAVCAVLAACATGGGRGEGGEDENVITRAELEQASGLDLYTLIDQRRPRWLTARGERTFAGENTVSVVVDGVRRGGVGTLRSIRTVTVQEVRYVNARDATTMYGPDMAGGAIVVTTRRAPEPRPWD